VRNAIPGRQISSAAITSSFMLFTGRPSRAAIRKRRTSRTGISTCLSALGSLASNAAREIFDQPIPPNLFRASNTYAHSLPGAFISASISSTLRFLTDSAPLAILLQLNRCDEGAAGLPEREPHGSAERKPAEKKAFLRAYEDSGSETESARLAGIERATHYKWLVEDTRYNAAFEAAKPLAAGALQDHAIRLATVGFFEPVIYKGQFQYAPRKRTLCLLADGTSVFRGRVAERRQCKREANGHDTRWREDRHAPARCGSSPENPCSEDTGTVWYRSPAGPGKFTPLCRWKRPAPI